MQTRTVAVVTGGRADYGQLTPLLRAIEREPQLQLSLIVTGAHLSKQFGHTVDNIKADGFTVAAEIDLQLSGDSAEAIARSMGIGVAGFAEFFARKRPDILVLLGDRYEIFAAAAAAVPFNIPTAHIHGGELTGGAIDDAMRHAITKLSHLHFVACEEYRNRVVQLGEDPSRVFVSGAPTLDNLVSCKFISKTELEKQFKISLEPPPLLVTFHPVTLEVTQTDSHMQQLLHALASFDTPIIFTMPNADPANDTIRRHIGEFAKKRAHTYCIEYFGLTAYWSVMRHATAMVGNSSSGLIEAPSFELPVVNIGTRQQNRMRAKNIIDVEPISAAITKGIRTALEPTFRSSLKNLKNPYGAGNASAIIIEQLISAGLNNIARKEFYNLTTTSK